MTEKRFTFNSDSDWWAISDNTTKKERLWGQDVVELLNELAEENKKLQSINQDHCDYIADVEADFVRLEKENKELKQSISDWQGSYDELYEDNLKLEKENKELREQLKNCTEKAKEEIRKQAENEAIRWANIGR